MARQFTLLATLLSCLLALSLAAAPRAALAENNGAGEVPDLKETLNKGLLARLPSEFAFIEKVVDEVNHKRLSRKTVLSMFTWARRQSDYMPFPYFQFGLRKQAKKEGVNL